MKPSRFAWQWWASVVLVVAGVLLVVYFDYVRTLIFAMITRFAD